MHKKYNYRLTIGCLAGSFLSSVNPFSFIRRLNYRRIHRTKTTRIAVLALSYIHFYARRKWIFDRISIINVYFQHLHTRVFGIILLLATIYSLHRITSYRDTCNIKSCILFLDTLPNIRLRLRSDIDALSTHICKIHAIVRND